MSGVDRGRMGMGLSIRLSWASLLGEEKRKTREEVRQAKHFKKERCALLNTWSFPGCSLLCSFRSARHRSRPWGRACASGSACSLASQSRSETGSPLEGQEGTKWNAAAWGVQCSKWALKKKLDFGRRTFNDSPGIQPPPHPLAPSLHHRVAADHGERRALLGTNRNVKVTPAQSCSFIKSASCPRPQMHESWSGSILKLLADSLPSCLDPLRVLDRRSLHTVCGA